MFWLAIFGNLTYGLAILVRQLDDVYVIRHIPWLVGSLGVILLDFSVSFKNMKHAAIIIWLASLVYNMKKTKTSQKVVLVTGFQILLV